MTAEFMDCRIVFEENKEIVAKPRTLLITVTQWFKVTPEMLHLEPALHTCIVAVDMGLKSLLPIVVSDSTRIHSLLFRSEHVS